MTLRLLYHQDADQPGSYVVLTVENHLPPEAVQVRPGHTVPMYASLFIFGFAYELLLFWDSLRLTSMIQVVGLCLYNLLLTVYAVFQPRQIHDALERLAHAYPMGGPPILANPDLVWGQIKPALIALIWVLAVGTLLMGFLAYKLHAEFAWLVYKVIHADIGMRRRVFTLEVKSIPAGSLPWPHELTLSSIYVDQRGPCQVQLLLHSRVPHPERRRHSQLE